MNHIAALTIAKSIQQERLNAADARRGRPALPRPHGPPPRTHVGELARVLLLGFRARPEPSR